MSFKIATFNVHLWSDGHHIDNFDRVLELVKNVKPDILCLQESDRDDESKFLKSCPEYTNSIFVNGCSIISKFPIEEIFTRSERPRKAKFLRYVCGKIVIPFVKKPIFVSCMHLDYKLEPKRLAQAEVIRDATKFLFDSNAMQIWTGDFNSLTREDYSEEEWNEIMEVRKRNSWEPPLTELTTKVKGYGLVDCWTKARKPEPIKTCRFNTRIDYVFCTSSVLDDFKLVSVRHVDDKASDHNMVVAEFSVKQSL